jgi:hypothetical protein
MSGQGTNGFYTYDVIMDASCWETDKWSITSFGGCMNFNSNEDVKIQDCYWDGSPEYSNYTEILRPKNKCEYGCTNTGPEWTYVCADPPP